MSDKKTELLPLMTKSNLIKPNFIKKKKKEVH